MAKKFYYEEKGFPVGMPSATKNDQSQQPKQTYYGSFPIIYSEVQQEKIPSTLDDVKPRRTAIVKFEDGTDDGYQVITETDSNGDRNIHELGNRNGVGVNIDRTILHDGTVLKNDTSYNGLIRGDIGYEQLQRQFETPDVQKNYNKNVSAPTTRDSKVNQKKDYKRGGYLRLQKQGGKLVEIWTPYN